MSQATTTPAEAQSTGQYRTPEGKRNIRVVVDEQLFVLLHMRAAQSKMRLSPYLRRLLVSAPVYDTPVTELTPTYAAGDPVWPEEAEDGDD